jgi:prolipoprotein diacylglyceryltransferase
MGYEITQAQIISSLLMIIGFVGIWYTRKMNKTLDHANS